MLGQYQVATVEHLNSNVELYIFNMSSDFDRDILGQIISEEHQEGYKLTIKNCHTMGSAQKAYKSEKKRLGVRG